MINIVDQTDENKKKGIEGANDEVLSNLKDERNITFEGGEILFPEVKFTNIQEALDYVQKQEYSLLQKNREDNSKVVKEVDVVLDTLAKIYQSPQRNIEDAKDFVQKYTGDLSNLIADIATKWKDKLLGGGRGNVDRDFLRRWGIDRKYLEKLEGEDLIKAFNRDVEKIDTASYEIAALVMSAIENILEEYKKTQNPFK